MEATELTWADRILLRGREQGQQEGLRVARQAVRRVLIQRFGPLPSSITMQLDQVGDPQRLEALLDVALSASALGEFESVL